MRFGVPGRYIFRGAARPGDELTSWNWVSSTSGNGQAIPLGHKEAGSGVHGPYRLQAHFPSPPSACAYPPGACLGLQGRIWTTQPGAPFVLMLLEKVGILGWASGTVQGPPISRWGKKMDRTFPGGLGWGGGFTVVHNSTVNTFRTFLEMSQGWELARPGRRDGVWVQVGASGSLV